ncbi:MAG: prolipoprotein diacylglyceryl transferase [Acidimicrobiaceae bacterium]|nr:prolipoprotein diacylglyceryl transferase [Acidimicrobiaceae bacterium]HBU75529.1 prolipoprotein diacylglyceryl transferase [Acidimicrobiaceae bacterium]|tara:strand:- start:187 stop:1023 length:837 start_codon:yes stop_codon:yes gene_type:complete
MLASIPSPSWSSLPIGPIELRVYGLLIAVGVVLAVRRLGIGLELLKTGGSEAAASIGVWGVGAGLIGARLYHVVTEWDRFSGNLSEIPKVWHGGLGVPGGVLLGTIVGVLRARSFGISTAETLHAAAPAIPLAQAVGRWGNWFNQELFGRPTTLPWALRIDDDHLPAAYESGTTFHPTFLYESMWTLGLSLWLVQLSGSPRLAGSRLFAMYVSGYGLGRLWIEGLRIDDASVIGGLRWNQWVAIAAIVGGLIYLAVSLSSGNSAEEVDMQQTSINGDR